MRSPSDFMLLPRPGPWLGGEPRTLAIHDDGGLSPAWPAEARLVEVQYQTGGMNALLGAIAATAGVPYGSIQALLENLEALSEEAPLVVLVRGSLRLLADVGPAVIALMTGWESFTHHASGISSMYLVLEIGPEALTSSAFYPGGLVRWLPDDAK
jgi:hypothetical protein